MPGRRRSKLRRILPSHSQAASSRPARSVAVMACHLYAPNRVPVVTTPKHARAVENLATAVDTDQVAHHRLISASPAKSLDKIGEPNWKRFVDPVLIAVLNPCAILASETALSGEAGRPPDNGARHSWAEGPSSGSCPWDDHDHQQAVGRFVEHQGVVCFQAILVAGA